MDGLVTHADEFVLTNHASEASGDLEAAALAFDSNHDGKLDGQDQRWAEFEIWQDFDQDAISDNGEVRTLAAAGITSIDLNGNPVLVSPGAARTYDNVVSQTAFFTRADGTLGQVGDVGFLYSTYGWRAVADGTGNVDLTTEDRSTLRKLANGQAHALDLGAAGLAGAVGASLADTLVAGAATDVLLEGGDGDDTLIVDGYDMIHALDGGDGIDTVIVSDAIGTSLDLGAARVEKAFGGGGKDRLWTSGAQGVVLNGGAGNDLLIIEASDRVVSIDGGEGIDSLHVVGSQAVNIDLAKVRVEVALGGQ